MGILAVLNLPPATAKRAGPPRAAASSQAGSHAAPAGRAAQPPEPVQVIEDGGAVWDNREVSEDEVNGGTPAGGTGSAAPPAAQTTYIVPVTLSVPIGKKLKYFEIEKLDIEGEVKFTPSGGGGPVEVSPGPGITAGKKPRVAPTVKFEVDLGKLKEMVFSDIASSTKQSGWQVDPKLECKLSSEGADVSIGIAVSCGWYSGSTKLVVIAKEKGKELQFANFTVEPISGTIKSREFEVAGVKGTLSGKIGATLVLKPAWDVIGAELAQKVARPVGSAALTVLGSQAFIIGGFASIAAAQAFAFIKSVSELQDIKAWQKAAEKGWLSFRSGFGSVWGFSWTDGGAGGLRQAGVSAGKADQDARMDAIREGIKRKEGSVPKDFGPEHLAALKELVTKHENEMGLLVERSYRRQVIAGFLDAYQAEHGDDFQFESNFRALRTLLGVTS